MKVSKKTRYGLRAMIELSLHRANGALSAKFISKRQDIPLQYLEQIFSRLKKAYLVKTTRGPKGGYLLSRIPAKITVKDIMRALGDADSLLECLNPKGQSCKKRDTCLARRFWRVLDERIDDILASSTLEDLCKGSKPLEDKNNISHHYLFQI